MPEPLPAHSDQAPGYTRAGVRRSLKGIVTIPLSILLISLLTAATANSQTFRGTILGTVTDSSGGVVPDATVKAKNVATGLERVTVTDTAGNYT
ncbi:MAG: carboxypeptidase-like regulatory domain-containing protein, partial [Blastocatellia bacterium]